VSLHDPAVVQLGVVAILFVICALVWILKDD